MNLFLSFTIGFLKHAKCLIEHVKLAPEYRLQCVKPLQQRMEIVDVYYKKDKPGMSGILRNTCCFYYHWENCIVGQLVDKCGEEAGKIIVDLIYYSSAMAVPRLCHRPRYNPNSPTNECVASEQAIPDGFMPKGIKSSNFLSFIFAYSCPNVGYGIFDSRDF